MGEVDELYDAVNHCVAQGDEGVHAAFGKAAEEKLKEIFHTFVPPRGLGRLGLSLYKTRGRALSRPRPLARLSPARPAGGGGYFTSSYFPFFTWYTEKLTPSASPFASNLILPTGVSTYSERRAAMTLS